MFVIHCRKCAGIVWGKWFRIWDSYDALDTSKYLQRLVQECRKGVEYRMVFLLED